MITRFAPSPTGPLHLGHAYSALKVWELANRVSGTALLRIEDTDSTRTRYQFEQGIYDDLHWLGLSWPEPVRRQSEHHEDYWQVLKSLETRGLIYPCSCNRRKIEEAGPARGVEGFVYPRTCRHRTMTEHKTGDAVRLNIHKALGDLPDPLTCQEIGDSEPHVETFGHDYIVTQIGDPVLKRKETGDPAYHLACTHDDALQKVTHVVRGEDVKPLTPIHLILQKLMGWPTPIYAHHPLITDENGKRLAKISKSKAIARYREDGATPDDLKRMVGFMTP